MKSKPPFVPPNPLDKMDIDQSGIPDIESIKSSNLYAKYAEKYKRLEDQKAKEMADKIADEKRKKRSDFLLDLFKALIIAVATLAIEHFMDIVRFFRDLLSGFSQ